MMFHYQLDTILAANNENPAGLGQSQLKTATL